MQTVRTAASLGDLRCGASIRIYCVRPTVRYDRLRARITRPLLQRQAGLPESIRQLAWKAQLRLCARYRRLLARGKAKNTIVTAIARELAAFIWAIGQAVEPITA